MIPSFKMIVFILLFMSYPSPASPQIYKWANKDGSIVYSDTPPSAETEKVTWLRLMLERPFAVTARSRRKTVDKASSSNGIR